jgi:membrane protease YdiL (CAAX protease family)
MAIIIRHPLSSFGWQTPVRSMFRPRHLMLFVVLGAIFCAFQYFVGSGAAPIKEGAFTPRQLAIGLPVVFLWLVIEVGLVEEFFFRGIVQARLAVFLRNEWAALFLASLVFALAHVPGLILRGAEQGDPWLVTANAILVLSAASITFGYIWMRTRNLLVLMMLHAAGDLLPNFAELSHTFGLN